jgi:hypothetical protein
MNMIRTIALVTIILMAFLALPLAAEEHTPFLDLGLIPDGDQETLAGLLESALSATDGLTHLGTFPYAGPDLVTENSGKRDGRGGTVICFEDRDFSRALLAVSPRYYLSALIRIGLHDSTDGGVHVTCLDPETHLRVICNDLESDREYEELVAAGTAARKRLLAVVKGSLGLNTTPAPLGAVRSTDRIRQGKKDMFMMVGPLTYYRKDSQFPRLYSEDLGDDPAAQLQELARKVTASLTEFTVGSDDRDYRWSQDPATDNTWQLLTRMEAPGEAILLGVSRPRTEALAAKIVSLSRDSDSDRSPGLDHLCAFPIEVLLMVNGDKVEIRTAKQMYRMDLFFWDAGKGAFMKYAQMPPILDRSLKRALLKGWK